MVSGGAGVLAHLFSLSAQHILIFFVAILYIGNAICASLSMEKTRATWDRIANETLEECLAAMEVHVTRASSSSIRRMWSRLPTPSCGWREEADYKILRFMFLRCGQLESTHPPAFGL